FTIKNYCFLSKISISTIIKELITKKLVNFVYKDLHPFEIIEDEGFRDFS
ncbi:17898_t:CDS:1, partial [Cetraspora pellucida]